MSISRIYKQIKTKGVKFNFLKIPVNPHPQDVAHNVRKDFDRERTRGLLKEAIEFLQVLELNPELLDTSRVRNLKEKLCAFRKELHEYKY